MKISKLFHWLYASLCFLPLLVAPIFALAVRSDNNFQPIEVQAKEYEVVDFNQLYNFSTINDETINGYSFINKDNYIAITGSPISTTGETLYAVNGYINLKKDCIYLLCDGLDQYNLSWGTNGISFRFTAVGESAYWTENGYNRFTIYSDTEGIGQFLIGNGNTNNSNLNYCFIPQLYNLTQMFGSGNEPTYQQFKQWYANDYYEYTLSHKELLNVGTTTLSDTDVGSQLLYTLYNTTDKYLNFDDVLNLRLINNWINLNVFNGNVPLVWSIIWHYLDYWLLLSIFWLCFDVLIYVPQIAHRWLDKASLE